MNKYICLGCDFSQLDIHRSFDTMHSSAAPATVMRLSRFHGTCWSGWPRWPRLRDGWCGLTPVT